MSFEKLHKMEGKGRQIAAKIKEKWNKLSDEQADAIASQPDKLVGTLQELYGFSEAEARKQALHMEQNLIERRQGAEVHRAMATSDG